MQPLAPPLLMEPGEGTSLLGQVQRAWGTGHMERVWGPSAGPESPGCVRGAWRGEGHLVRRSQGSPGRRQEGRGSDQKRERWPVWREGQASRPRPRLRPHILGSRPCPRPCPAPLLGSRPCPRLRPHVLGSRPRPCPRPHVLGSRSCPHPCACPDHVPIPVPVPVPVPVPAHALGLSSQPQKLARHLRSMKTEKGFVLRASTFCLWRKRPQCSGPGSLGLSCVMGWEQDPRGPRGPVGQGVLRQPSPAGPWAHVGVTLSPGDLRPVASTLSPSLCLLPAGSSWLTLQVPEGDALRDSGSAAWPALSLT